ncbi:MAG TPA: hypothetical protein VFV49_01120 [Thermoanaerobaculia bacterium]|nr:hypothetical protein [Thermoanaerobaculia bacterium]
MHISRNGVLRGITLLALLAVVGLPNAFADDPPSPFDPPEARIGPVGGIASEARIGPPSGVTSQSRIRPPGGEPPQTDARIQPPGGVTAPEPSFFELLLEWLQAQARISPTG